MSGSPAIAVTAIITWTVLGADSVTPTAEKWIRFRTSDREIVAAMVDNSASRSLLAMLPLTLQFEDYGGTEKISSLPRRLDTSDVPAGHDPSPGDLTLYAPWGNLAFFYRDHGYARGLVPLGKVVSGAAFLEEMDRAAAVHVEAVE